MKMLIKALTALFVALLVPAAISAFFLVML